MHFARTLTVIAAFLLMLAAPAWAQVERLAKDSPTVPNPVVEGPVSGGIRGGAYNRTRVDLVNGYVEEEFFISGNARGAGGIELPYKTRILVRRPSDPAFFNGGVVLDWDNTSVPDPTDVNWVPMHITLMERGYVYVSVAAQRLGVEASPLALKQYDPVRYGSLLHLSDDCSYDIFAQAAEAVLDPAVLGDLAALVTRRLAVGASQSAIKLTDYVNEYAADQNVFDGVMPQLNAPDAINHSPPVPVLFLNSQSEMRDTEPAPDTDGFVLWEMSGVSHAPFGYTEYQNTGYIYHQTNGAVDLYEEETALAWGYQLAPGECTTPNTFDAGHLYSAALIALDDWVTQGIKPRGWRADRSGGELQFDRYDNLMGGIRSPLIEAPIARYYANSIPPGNTPCGLLAPTPLLGSTQAMSVEDLQKRYGTTDAYVKAFEEAVKAALADGTLLPEGAAELRARVKYSIAWVAEVLGPPSGVAREEPSLKSEERFGGAMDFALLAILLPFATRGRLLSLVSVNSGIN